MLKIGDKIKYVKANPLIEMPIGTEMTVTDIKGITVAIEASFELGNCKAVVQGLMSYDEVEKYFEKVVETETKSETPKRVWTEWTKIDDVEKLSCRYIHSCSDCWFTKLCDFFDMDNIEFRTNGKKVMARKSNDNHIKSEATCHKADTFDLTTGLKVAIARLAVKEAEHNLKTLIEEIG